VSRARPRWTYGSSSQTSYCQTRRPRLTARTARRIRTLEHRGHSWSGQFPGLDCLDELGAAAANCTRRPSRRVSDQRAHQLHANRRRGVL
jgi:hypothetical protein